MRANSCRCRRRAGRFPRHNASRRRVVMALIPAGIYHCAARRARQLTAAAVNMCLRLVAPYRVSDNYRRCARARYAFGPAETAQTAAPGESRGWRVAVPASGPSVRQ